MANIDAPGYRTRGFDFGRAIWTAAAASREAAGNTSGAGQATVSPHLEDVDHLFARPDGSNVSMDREGLQMATSQLQFRTGVELVKREYSRVLNAIHADTK